MESMNVNNANNRVEQQHPQQEVFQLENQLPRSQSHALLLQEQNRHQQLPPLRELPPLPINQQQREPPRLINNQQPLLPLRPANLQQQPPAPREPAPQHQDEAPHRGFQPILLHNQQQQLQHQRAGNPRISTPNQENNGFRPRGARGGNQTKREYYRQKYNPYNQALGNVATYMVKLAMATTSEVKLQQAAKRFDDKENEDEAEDHNE